jgi:hypothetical protein
MFDKNRVHFMNAYYKETEKPQRRHRNASVILLLQNMFPKGKFNTDISRNAQYLALFRSPSDIGNKLELLENACLIRIESTL